MRVPELKEFILVFSFETLHVCGLALLLFKILPKLDVVKCIMLTHCVCLTPGILGEYLMHRNSL